MGDAVFQIGQGGKAKKGKIVVSIGKDSKGRTVPTVQWAGGNDKSQTTFGALKKDSYPSANPVAPSTSRNDKGPTPMELDSVSKASGSRSGVTCNRCGGKGHIAKDCGTPNKINTLESDNEGSLSLKGEA